MPHVPFQNQNFLNAVDQDACGPDAVILHGRRMVTHGEDGEEVMTRDERHVLLMAVDETEPVWERSTRMCLRG